MPVCFFFFFSLFFTLFYPRGKWKDVNQAFKELCWRWEIYRASSKFMYHSARSFFPPPPPPDPFLFVFHLIRFHIATVLSAVFPFFLLFLPFSLRCSFAMRLQQFISITVARAGSGRQEAAACSINFPKMPAILFSAASRPLSLSILLIVPLL